LQNPLATPVSLAIRSDVARKPKIEVEKAATPAGVDAIAPAPDAASAPQPKAKAASSKPKKKRAAPKKKSAPRATSTDSGKASTAPQIAEPSDDDIRLRAYFIAERRIQFSLPGDSDHDWIEARRQLIEEAQR
jgi:hypothetical protein